jgi:hypothetical protein
VFTLFLDTQLLPMSNEKRSVALHLTTLLVQRCPAEFLPIALTPVCTIISILKKKISGLSIPFSNQTYLPFNEMYFFRLLLIS